MAPFFLCYNIPMKIFRRFGLIIVAAVAAATAMAQPVLADEECTGEGTRFSVSPTAKDLQIKAGETISEKFELKNMSSEATKFKIYAEPYSNTGDDKDFSTETTYTQMSRWINFVDASGGSVRTLEITVPGCTTREIAFTVAAPDSVPDGGQYAAIFAEGSNGSSESSTISTSSRVGVLLYGRVSGGKTMQSASLSEISLERDDGLKGKDGKTLTASVIYGSAKISNDGNIDINVDSTLTVRTLLGREVYQNTTSISLLPGTTDRKITEVWESTPAFGLFVAEYNIKTGTGINETVSRVFLLVPLPLLLILIVALIIVAVGIISFIKKQRQKRLRTSWVKTA